MKILCITPEYPPDFSGGISTYYATLLPFMGRLGAEVTTIVGSAFEAGSISSNNRGGSILPLDHHRANAFKGSFSALSLTPDLVNHLAAAWAVWEQTEGGKDFDVVECTDWGLFFVPWLLEASSPPLVVRLHGSEGQISHHNPESCSPLYGSLCRLIETALLPRASMLVTFSRANQQAWCDQLNRKVEYCPPPLAVKKPDIPQTLRNERGLVVGRVQQWKGPETLCRALQLMGNSAPIIDWVGRSVMSQATGKQYDDYLRRKYAGIWGTRIVHHPPELPVRIGERQANASFVIVPSTWDVFNLTAAEAMAREAIVICSSGAGAVDLIEHGVNGFVFQGGDEKNLAEVIRQVQALTREERFSIGYKAREKIIGMLNPSDIARQTLAQFDQARNTPRYPKIADDLLRSALSPNESHEPTALAMNLSLDRLDLKLLLKHVAGRLKRKVSERFDR